MSKIVKKKDLDVLIEGTLKKAGIEIPKKEEKKVIVAESKEKKIVVTETIEKKEILSEEFKKELASFNKLTNYKY